MLSCADCPGRCPHGACVPAQDGCLCTNPEPTGLSNAAAGLTIAFFAILCVLGFVVTIVLNCDFSAVDSVAPVFLEPVEESPEEDAEEKEESEQNAV